MTTNTVAFPVNHLQIAQVLDIVSTYPWMTHCSQAKPIQLFQVKTSEFVELPIWYNYFQNKEISELHFEQGTHCKYNTTNQFLSIYFSQIP